MGTALRFLVIDGYAKASRDDLDTAGMQYAWKLYGDMVQRNLPGAEYDVLLPSDFGIEMPGEEELKKYSGILWTGCNLSIFDEENSSVRKQIELARLCYEIGIPSFGSCWGLQMSVVAAGGKVAPNPLGKKPPSGQRRERARKHPPTRKAQPRSRYQNPDEGPPTNTRKRPTAANVTVSARRGGMKNTRRAKGAATRIPGFPTQETAATNKSARALAHPTGPFSARSCIEIYAS